MRDAGGAFVEMFGEFEPVRFPKIPPRSLERLDKWNSNPNVEEDRTMLASWEIFKDGWQRREWSMKAMKKTFFFHF